MKINWFPGHMKKNLDTMKENIKKIDVVLYVLDARAPFSCLNPKIDEIVENRTILYVINKVDLIEKNDAEKIVSIFKNQNKNVISLQATASSNRNVLLQKLKELVAEKYERRKSKGVEPVFKVMVIGTPNTGKSTIINTLYGQKKAITGDRAGVTKANQWVKISDNFVLLDTPGTLWPKLENEKIATNLAFVGSIKTEVLDQEELGFELAKYLISNHQKLISNRYGISNFDAEPIDIYDEILRKSGCIIRGGEVDYNRGAVKILEDFRSGRIGKICLDNIDLFLK